MRIIRVSLAIWALALASGCNNEDIPDARVATVFDAAVIDAAVIDAVVIDANTTDANTTDANTTLDANTTDAVPLALVSFAPAPASVLVGATVTLTATLNRAAPAGGTDIAIATSASGTASVAATTINVVSGATTATVVVTGVAAGSANITATYGVTLTSVVTVSLPPPVVSVINPPAGTTLSVLASGGTGILTVVLDRVVTSDTPVALLSATPASVAVPASVTVPAGFDRAPFRVRADATVAVAAVAVTATLNSVSDSIDVAVVIAPTAPTTTAQLVINEVNVDAFTDANCDGATSAISDEFVEISNRTGVPLALNNVSLWNDSVFLAGAGTVPLYTFAAITLGPGEAVLVFNGVAPSGAGTAEWCAGSMATRIGDASVYLMPVGVGAEVYVDSGDTVTLTLTVLASSTTLDTVTWAANPTDQALAASPDFSDTFVGFTTISTIMAGWVSSPGFLVNGRLFAWASPA